MLACGGASRGGDPGERSGTRLAFSKSQRFGRFSNRRCGEEIERERRVCDGDRREPFGGIILLLPSRTRDERNQTGPMEDGVVGPQGFGLLALWDFGGAGDGQRVYLVLNGTWRTMQRNFLFSLVMRVAKFMVVLRLSPTTQPKHKIGSSQCFFTKNTFQQMTQIDDAFCVEPDPKRK